MSFHSHLVLCALKKQRKNYQALFTDNFSGRWRIEEVWSDESQHLERELDGRKC